MIIHFGVIDVPYSGPADAPRRSVTRRRPDGSIESFTAPASGAETTGDVATWLEEKYHVMEVFLEERRPKIETALEKSLEGAIENLLLGGPLDHEAFAEGESEVGALFRAFLSERGMDAVGVPGVPTKAAQKGVNHRLKHPYSKDNKERPSFIDTGLYQASFRVWID